MSADLAPLLYWVRERDALKARKASGVPQEYWTADPILKQYRFCNVRRRDDRVSQWLLENVLSKYAYAHAPDFLLFTALCRHINWPPTVKAIMDAGLYPVAPINLKAIGRFIDRRYRSGQKTWTGAYMVRADPGTEKGSFVAEKVVGGLAYATSLLFRAMMSSDEPVPRREVHAFLCHHSGWGSFMAGQVVDDWTWTPLLANAPDLFNWAPIGPGSARGFNRLMGRPLNAPVPEEEWDQLLPQWLDAVNAELGQYGNLTAMDLQSCLCETDKYLRVKNGEGRPRSLYTPETEF